MKHLYLLFILLAFSLSSCFEIIEEVDLHSDGTGTYEYTINLSQSRSKLDQIMRLDSIHGYRVPKKSEIKEPLQELVTKASAVAGITNPKTKEDLDNYIVSFSCDFADIDALNRLVAALRKGNKEVKSDIPEVHFTYDAASKRYVRNGDYSIQADFSQMKEADKIIFDGATFTSIFRSDVELADYSNKQAKLSPNKKALMLRMAVLDLIKEKVSMGNTIYFTQ